MKDISPDEMKTRKAISKNLVNLMDNKDMNNNELANIIGVDESTVGKWILMKSTPRMGAIEKIANYFNINKSDILEDKSDKVDNIIKLDRVNKIPVLGQIACGDPILAQENLQGNVLVDFIHADFAVIAKGDSMVNAGITEGDYCFIRQQPDVENGEIAAVLIDQEATLKKVYKTDNQILLMPENDKHEPIILKEDIKILGKLVGIYKSVI